ncbi:MAG: hypothetical protein ABI972_22645 [Acidobacteriota bacterium]
MPSHKPHLALAPPRIAWARRWILLGVLLLAAAYIVDDWAEIYGPYLADRVEASGDLRVGHLTDNQVQAAFDRTRAAQRVEAALLFLNADHQGRRYEVRLHAPDREQAVERAKNFLDQFAAECTAQSGNVLWTNHNATPQSQMSPLAGLWLRRIKLGLLFSGLAFLALGGLLYIDPRKLRLRI